jgi:hypothetical protein
MISQYFIGGMMPRFSYSHARKHNDHRNSTSSRWVEVFRSAGVEPYWVGHSAKHDATSYATARAKFAKCEIRVLNNTGEVVEKIALES